VTTLAASLVGRRLLLVGWLLVGLAATVQEVRLSRFMVDPSHADDSVIPWSSFFREHSCLSAYTEAARLAPTGANVYDPKVYADPSAKTLHGLRRIGPFEVDIFEYPPAFLVLPRAVVAAGLDFFTIRRVWFALQTVLLIGTMAGLAVWIGGRAGLRTGLLIPAVLAAPPVALTLQTGNFQITALSLVILAMLAFARARPMVGGLALGFAAVSKIFPGALGLLLLASRRWRAVSWTVAASLALVALAVATLGIRPFDDFVHFQLPRLRSGDAFFWIEMPPMALINQSIYGLVTKLRLLGLPWTDKNAAMAICNLYVVALVLLAALAARRLREADASGLAQEAIRVRHAQTWLALFSLASLRSPFVPPVYGTIGSLWLLTLLAAEGGTRVRQGALAIAALVFCGILDPGALPFPVPRWEVGLTLGAQLLVLAVNVWAVARRPQGVLVSATRWSNAPMGSRRRRSGTSVCERSEVVNTETEALGPRSV
jgi:alpha-1,2-mannosyltransferase